MILKTVEYQGTILRFMELFYKIHTFRFFSPSYIFKCTSEIHLDRFQRSICMLYIMAYYLAFFKCYISKFIQVQIVLDIFLIKFELILCDEMCARNPLRPFTPLIPSAIVCAQQETLVIKLRNPRK
jgi:hypothetical protein